MATWRWPRTIRDGKGVPRNMTRSWLLAFISYVDSQPGKTFLPVLQTSMVSASYFGSSNNCSISTSNYPSSTQRELRISTLLSRQMQPKNVWQYDRRRSWRQSGKQLFRYTSKFRSHNYLRTSPSDDRGSFDDNSMFDNSDCIRQHEEAHRWTDRITPVSAIIYVAEH